MRQQLEISGIKVFLAKDDGGGLYPQLQLTRGVAVKVAKKDEEAAIEILQGARKTIYELPNHQTDKDKHEEDIVSRINSMLRKSKVWAVIGFLGIPGWICLPVSFHYAFNALKLYNENDFTNIEIKHRIKRLLYISGILSVLFWVLLGYLLYRKYS